MGFRLPSYQLVVAKDPQLSLYVAINTHLYNHQVYRSVERHQGVSMDFNSAVVCSVPIYMIHRAHELARCIHSV